MPIKAKKSLGQNFLKNKDVLRKMAEAGEVGADDTVLEVGPGEGTLTEELLARAGKVIAVEKDDRLIPYLQKKFSAEISSGKLVLIHSDILSLNTSDFKDFQLFSFREISCRATTFNFKLISNIPYYITGQILRQFLQSDCQPSKIVLLVQKEVAKRIVAEDRGKARQSILSISVKAYGEPKYISTVKAGNFQPAPKVDSAIILINNISKKNFAGIDEKKFFEILKKGFGSKRKFLFSNLGLKKGQEIIFSEAGIDRKVRAEELTLAQWGKLALLLKKI
jgi:16S rRNA (adenine1518-N6/adenine1519-N6)-dimethyltransferase